MTTLLDLMREPMIVRPVDRDSPIVQADEKLEWGKPWSRYAAIELHRHDDGLWMWSRSFGLLERAAGYRVGPKWGRRCCRLVTSDDDTQAWIDSAACEGECRDRAAGGQECRDKCARWLQACAAWRKATPERRAGFVTRRRAAKSSPEERC